MKKRLAIITSGGGMKCCWGAGVLLALKNKFAITNPDFLISASGSAGTSAYYLAKQYKDIKRIWTSGIVKKKAINPLRFWKVIDVNYVIDEIFKKEEPLDAKKVCQSKTILLTPCISRDTGAIKYFTNKDKIDIFEMLRATKAIPIAFQMNPKVMIKNKAYCDSKLTSEGVTHLKKAVELGAKRIIVIDSDFPTIQHRIRDFLSEMWLDFQGSPFRYTYYDAERKARLYTVPKDVEVIIITPTTKPGIRILVTNKKVLTESFNLGYQETVDNKELEKFLK
ncbi:MAG: putative patatin/cPLA2 family phospholipase [Candidatus Woesearchaeota archaeon]|jgi:predicted patatin/cPLA2 family phospholipase